MAFLYDQGPGVGTAEEQEKGEDTAAAAFKQLGFDVFKWIGPDRGIDLLAARKERRGTTRTGTNTGQASAHLLALQVKSGHTNMNSARTAGSIEVGKHQRYWSESTCPVLLVAHYDGELYVEDPNKQLVALGNSLNECEAPQNPKISVPFELTRAANDLRARAVLGALYPEIWGTKDFGSVAFDAGDVAKVVGVLSKLSPSTITHSPPVRPWLPALHYVGVLSRDTFDESIIRQQLLPHSEANSDRPDKMNADHLKAIGVPQMLEAGFLHIVGLAIADRHREVIARRTDSDDDYESAAIWQRYPKGLVAECMIAVGQIIGTTMVPSLSTNGSDDNDFPIDSMLPLLHQALSSRDPAFSLLEAVYARSEALMEICFKSRLEETNHRNAPRAEVLIAEEFPFLPRVVCVQLAEDFEAGRPPLEAWRIYDLANEKGRCAPESASSTTQPGSNL